MIAQSRVYKVKKTDAAVLQHQKPFNTRGYFTAFARGLLNRFFPPLLIGGGSELIAHGDGAVVIEYEP